MKIIKWLLLICLVLVVCDPYSFFISYNREQWDGTKWVDMGGKDTWLPVLAVVQPDGSFRMEANIDGLTCGSAYTMQAKAKNGDAESPPGQSVKIYIKCGATAGCNDFYTLTGGTWRFDFNGCGSVSIPYYGLASVGKF